MTILQKFDTTLQIFTVYLPKANNTDTPHIEILYWACHQQDHADNII